ncbi:DUF3280 domain-containing protein [Ancylobacter dichloromethanicus]|uniref:DUF2380 domain-containing protein n=1 Tax=Ancylobacter dichloromethanicus TaxID=518825 RepID=A0A9W6N102_9HYPH|nr:DUF3280 domain-containing protein [Ancylobacter dichloromethanicus]MBS7555192.1 DUF3280 domain-containing protein [Ancylobacter dichloromethanicus]GLK73693.1 hypothetical protein GCM10017643_38110 [Ancylobacter dichloromethanicus]
MRVPVHARLTPGRAAACASALALLGALIGLGVGVGGQAAEAKPATRVAVFEFELLDTSGEFDIHGPKPAEVRRLDLITDEVRRRLKESGYEVVDLAPQRAEIAEATPFRNCNGCELKIARALGAEIEVIGLVQKVSNLILNINFQLRDAATGQVLRAGSADIRNNTDESWLRGVSYLVRNRLLDPPLTGKAAP